MPVLLLSLLLLGSACDLEASRRTFQPGTRSSHSARARAAWHELLPVEPSDDLLGDDLDLPMGAEEGMVIPSACGACGCLKL